MPESPSTPPKSAPTLRDVARVAGVHKATASRALNPDTRGLVNTETAKRVARAAEQLGYQVNPIARSLRTSKSFTVGVVIPNIDNPLFPPIVRGIQDVLEPEGYSALIVNTDDDLKREESAVAKLRSRQVDGLIIATARLSHPLLDRLSAESVRMVLMNRRPDHPVIPSVIPDDAAGIELAVRHLASLGHRRIAHLQGPQDTSTGRTRSRSFASAMRALSLDEDPKLVVTCASWTESEGARAITQLLDEAPNFSAILAGNDLIALGCYTVFGELNIRCPEDVSIVGFNDMPYLNHIKPALTSVSVPHTQLGVEAARLLLECIREPGRTARSVLLPTGLVIRGSTAPVAGDDRMAMHSRAAS